MRKIIYVLLAVLIPSLLTAQKNKEITDELHSSALASVRLARMLERNLQSDVSKKNKKDYKDDRNELGKIFIAENQTKVQYFVRDYYPVLYIPIESFYKLNLNTTHKKHDFNRIQIEFKGKRVDVSDYQTLIQLNGNIKTHAPTYLNSDAEKKLSDADYRFFETRLDSVSWKATKNPERTSIKDLDTAYSLLFYWAVRKKDNELKLITIIKCPLKCPLQYTVRWDKENKTPSPPISPPKPPTVVKGDTKLPPIIIPPRPVIIPPIVKIDNEVTAKIGGLEVKSASKKKRSNIEKNDNATETAIHALRLFLGFSYKTTVHEAFDRDSLVRLFENPTAVKIKITDYEKTEQIVDLQTFMSHLEADKNKFLFVEPKKIKINFQKATVISSNSWLVEARFLQDLTDEKDDNINTWKEKFYGTTTVKITETPEGKFEAQLEDVSIMSQKCKTCTYLKNVGTH